MSRVLSDRSGSDDADFSLVTPFLLFLMVTVTCGGLYLGMMSSVSQVAADAARYAMAGIDPDERILLAEKWVSNVNNRYALLNHKGLSVTTIEIGSALVVSVRYDTSALPLIPVLASSMSMSAAIEKSTTVFLR